MPERRKASSSKRNGRKPAARESKAEEPRSSARPHWSGTLSFGLVSIPVELYPGNRSGGVPLRMLATDGTPLRRRYVCSEEDVLASPETLVRGYEWKPGQYVVVTDEELESLEPDKSRDIDLRSFVPAGGLDPSLFVRSYVLAPSGDTSKAYHLLLRAMRDQARAGIATFVMRDKEYLVAIMAEGGLLRAHVLRFADELRSAPALPRAKPAKAEIDRFSKLIDERSQDRFDLDELHDEDAEELRKLAERKARKHEDVVEAESSEAAGSEPGADVIDLMQVLKKSLGASASKSKSASRS